MKISIIFIAMTALCVSMGAQAQNAGKTTQVFTGIVEDAKPLEIKKDNKGKGVVAGAAIGATRKSSNRTRSVVTGAAVGGALGRRSSSSQAGMEYAIRTGPTSLISVVSNQTEIHKGDCVSVQQSGDKSTITRVDSKKCEAIVASMKASSSGDDACAKAKADFANASTKEAMDLAKSKMDVLCK